MKKNSKIIVCLVIVCLIYSISLVSASEISDDGITTGNDYSNEENLNVKTDDTSVLNQNGDCGTFTDFYNDLISSGKEFNLTRDYAYDKNDSKSAGFKIGNLTINGNNHVINASASDFKFQFLHDRSSSSGIGNLIINDLTITNFKSSPLWVEKCNIIFNNVNFTDCFYNKSSLITVENSIELTVNNCNFMSNKLLNNFNLKNSKVIIKDSYFSGIDCIGSAVILNRGQLIVENSIFENYNAFHGSIINYKGDYISIKKSKFLNSHANATGGAIIIKFFPLHEVINDETIIYYTSDSIIENSQFINLSSASNGGAIHLDMDSGTERVYPTLIVKDSNFTDCSSKYGGAISVIGGYVNITSSNFTDNNAGFEGGSIYTSWTNLNITNSTFTANTAAKNAGALYFDKGNLIINGSNFTHNNILETSNNTANAIYAHDVNAYFYNSGFDNGGVGVYTDFTGDSQMMNVTKNNDTFLMDNHDYITSIETPGIKLNLTGNQINVDTLPSRFDVRDWGWITPQKIQGDNTDCWAFATTASIETALLKSTGIAYNISENYVQKLQLKYFKAGDLRNSLTGFSYSGLGYVLSWYGVLPTDSVYDDRGMIMDTDLNDERIHVQDAVIIYTGQNDTIENLKRAIIKYGAVSVQAWMHGDEEIPTEGEDIAIMDHDTHFVSLIGWDDNYKQGEFEPKFVWFTKDSLVGFGIRNEDTFPNKDIYAIAPQRAAIAYIFENTNDYHVNYQTDLTGLAGFDGNYTTYSNEFTSKYDELIGAVGTYFNESGINYSFDVFVNGEKVHTQTGVSEFAGFRTIVLNTYIPVNVGDVFKVVFKSNCVPYQAWSRVHYRPGASLAGNGEDWVDFATLNKTVCLKVYTVANDTPIDSIVVSAPDVTKYYGGSERFVVTVTDSNNNPLANKSVNITLNGITYNRITDANGTASIAITLVSGQYNVTTLVDNNTVNSMVNILTTVNGTDLVKVFRNETQYYATFRDSQGNYLKEGTAVRFNIHGVMYDRKVSGDKGLAKLNINLEQGEYIITAINLETGESRANNITVIPRIIENYDLTKYYRNASQYTVKIIGDDGKAVGAGINVTFNINGVFYTRTTNASGIAKLNINLNPGDYIITAEHDGCLVSNKIKVLPVLTAKDLTKKYATPDQFVATLVDGQGKAYPDQTIQFNINGIFYNRITDSTGQAKLNINLQPGEYIITSTYNGTSIGNKVTVTA